MTRKTPPVYRGTAAREYGSSPAAKSAAAAAMQASGPTEPGAAASSSAPLVPPPPHSPPLSEEGTASPALSSAAAPPVVSPSRRPRAARPDASQTMIRGTSVPQSRETRGLRQADALIASGDTDKAVECLRRLTQALPASPRISLRMATLLREKHRAGEALDVLQKAVGQAPRQAIALREALAELCLEVGYWEQAIQHCHVLLEVSPRSLLARDILSAAHLQRGNLSQALHIVEEMIRLDPNDAANHFKRGVLLQQQGCIGAAVGAFSRVLDMDPDGEAVSEARAALEILDNYQIRQIVTLAVEDIPFRVALREDCAGAVYQRGYILSENGLAALSQMRFSNLPAAPPGWRQYFYH